MERIAIVGASGEIGRALTNAYLAQGNIETVYALARNPLAYKDTRVKTYPLDIESEETIKSTAHAIQKEGELDKVIVATGLLHQDTMQPEKSLRDIKADNFQKMFAVNTIGPALIAKHFLPLLYKNKRSICAVLSARVGSISDNKLGGWYAYRASKAALNMILKNASIEMARRYKQSIIVGLHPGTVDTPLSKPFQAQVKPEKLFTPNYAAEKLITVLEGLTPADTGNCYAWDGNKIEY